MLSGDLNCKFCSTIYKYKSLPTMNNIILNHDKISDLSTHSNIIGFLTLTVNKLLSFTFLGLL